tara:strand:- start:5176 stop:5658 length:483 start_codon:yes stop_codon:yes gene_type:complete
LINIKKLTKINLKSCLDLIDIERDNFCHLMRIGWSEKQIKLQLNKVINYSLGIFDNKCLVAFILGDLITIEKVSEYEILIIYVKKSNRNKGLATKLLNHIEKEKQHLNLKKIYLEVSADNNKAINFYKRNDFKLINIRPCYYSIDNQKFDALCYTKFYDK